MIPQAVLVESVGEGGGKRSVARSLHIYKLAFQSCRYVATRAQNIRFFLCVFFFFLLQGTKKNKINKTLATAKRSSSEFSSHSAWCCWG